MKMSLKLYSDPSAMASIERFAFTGLPSNVSSALTERLSIASCDLDPLIEEQDIRVDMGSNTGTVNYAVAIPIEVVDQYPKQEMDKYPAKWFFYVTSIKRKRSSTVCELSLKLDAVTTLFYGKTANVVNNFFTPQSYIRREHRNRFLYPTDKSGTEWQYNIDKIPENIPVTMKKLRMNQLDNYGTSKQLMKWYIVYKAKKAWGSGDVSSSNALETFFLPHDSLKISDSTSSGTGSDVDWSVIGDFGFAVGMWYYVSDEWSPGFDFDFAGDTLQASNGIPMVAILIESISGNEVRGKYRTFGGSTGEFTSIVQSGVVMYSGPYASFRKLSYFRSLAYYTTNMEEIRTGAKYQINAGTTTVAEIDSIGFNDLDRTDPLLVKVIETPYAPAELKVSGTNYSLENCTFDQATKMFKPTGTTKWWQRLTYNTSAVILPSVATYKTITGRSYSDSWDLFDPKLLHSDFYAIKIVYDTFSVNIELENMVISGNTLIKNTSARAIAAYWHISPDLNSVFAIEAEGLNSAEASSFLKSHTQDFGQWAVVDRNNEKPLFTNAYLNYMRVGYNYDQKAKALQNWSAMTGIVLSAIGTIAGAATGQTHITAMSAAGLIASISSAAFGAASRENSMQAKMGELKAQGTSVAGSSDVAILDLYSQKACIVEYAPDQEIRYSLARLFHYFGYATGCFKKPDVMSRSLWNYLEGDIVFDQGLTAHLPQQILERAIRQFKDGLTLMHYDTYSVLDMTQYRYNWENVLLS